MAAKTVAVVALLLVLSIAEAQKPAIVQVTKLPQESVDQTECTGDFSSTLKELYDGAGTATCYNMDMPIVHSAGLEAGTFNYFVVCFQAKDASPTNTMFWVQGGPGAEGKDIHTLPKSVPESEDLQRSDWKHCIPDHRGTGRSFHLDCEDGSHKLVPGSLPSQACWENHLSLNEDFLRNMTVRNAAMDTWVAVNTLGSGLENTFAYAVGYGTNLMLKYLSFAPAENLRGVILDSVTPTYFGYSRYEEYKSLVVGEYLAACGLKSYVCRDCLGNMPLEKADQLLDKLTYGPTDCIDKIEGLTRESLQEMLGGIMMNDNGNRDLMAPFLYRVLNPDCTQEDVDEATNFLKTWNTAMVSSGNRRQLAENATASSSGDSTVVWLALMAELWTPDWSKLPSNEEFIARSKILHGGKAFLLPDWYEPLYIIPFDEVLALPNLETTGVVFLAGTLDPTTTSSAAQWAHDRTSAPYLKIMYFTDVAQSTLTTSQAANQSDSTCAGGMVADFLVNGNISRKKAACVSKWADFDGVDAATKKASSFYFKSEEVWGRCSAYRQGNAPPSDDGDSSDSNESDSGDGSLLPSQASTAGRKLAAN